MTPEDLQGHLRKGGQILKTRDDPAPVSLERDGGGEETDKLLKVSSDSKCSWVKANETLGSEKLRPRMEPWLTALAQSEHLSLVLGSGLTHAVHAIATSNSLPGMSSITFDVLNEEITTAARHTAKLAGRNTGNFEDQMRTASDLVRGLEIIASTKEGDDLEHGKLERLQRGMKDILDTFANSILKGEQQLISAPDEMREQAFNYLVSFLMSFASRSGTA